MSWGVLRRTPFVFLFLAACAPSDAPPPPTLPAATEPRRPTPASVSRPRGLEVAVRQVVDGDTLRVTGLPGGDGLVRLTGINAPETGDGRTTRECFGPEARQWLQNRLGRGARVELVTDVGERDRFGRFLAYAYATDGSFLNAELVAKGYARTMNIRPNVRHAGELSRLQAAARSQRLGLWGACGLERQERRPRP